MVNHILEGATLDDIDLQTIEIFKQDVSKAGRIKNVQSMELVELLSFLGLYSNAGLTKAAIILFGKDFAKHYPNQSLVIGRFDVNNLLAYHEECHDNLIKSYHKTIDLLRSKYVLQLVSFEGWQRYEDFEYPEDAMKEIVLNALVHRDYLIPATIQIKVKLKEMTVSSPGLLVEDMTINKLLCEQRSCPRNKLLAKACYYAGYTEKEGRGIEIIRDSSIEHNLPPPEFEVNKTSFIAKLRKREINEKIKVSRTKKKTVKDKKRTNELNVLECMVYKQNITIPEIAYKLNLSNSGVNLIIKILRNEGVIKRIGSDKKGYWEVIHKTY